MFSIEFTEQAKQDLKWFRKAEQQIIVSRTGDFLMMLWNYRLVAIGDRVGLYEIFYEPDGQILACGQDPITLEADSPEELENYLQGLQEALTLPILKMEDLPPIPQHPPIVQRGTPIEALWEELGLEKDELAIVRG